MKANKLALAGAMALLTTVTYAVGWVETGIAPEWPVARVATPEANAFQEDFFEEQAPQTDVWSPVRVGLGWGKHSTTNYVCSLPYVWSDVYGLQVEVLSCACDVYGIQCCLAGAGSNVYGVQASLGNYVYGDAYGCQAGAAFSVARKAAGLQVSGGCSMSDELCGIQLGGLASGTRTSALGLQVAALVNTAIACDGLQVGLFNFAEKGTVVQIGLWNVYGERGDARHLPILNVGW